MKRTETNLTYGTEVRVRSHCCHAWSVRIEWNWTVSTKVAIDVTMSRA